MPALGLSNKAIFSDVVPNMAEDLEIKPGDNEQYVDNTFTNVSLKGWFKLSVSILKARKLVGTHTLLQIEKL